MQLFSAPNSIPPLYTLEEEESKHCIRVLRLKQGDKLHLTDGKGNLYLCQIVDPHHKHCMVEVVETYNEYEKMPYEYDLKIARQNRVGHQANDFYYTTADGKRCKMHNVKAEYLIIFISNPGCPMCREVKETLLSSPQLNVLTERGKLKVLVLYPDTDLDAWRAHLGDYPEAWINGYDANQSITKENLYDLRAIPALYLLDSKKQVVAKDCTDVAYIESLIMQAEEK